VLATKAAQSTGPNITNRGLSRRHLMQSVDASLTRLQTDHIDLYYIHRVDPDTAWEQTIATFGDLIRQGPGARVGALQREVLAYFSRVSLEPAAWRAAAGGTAALPTAEEDDPHAIDVPGRLPPGEVRREERAEGEDDQSKEP
jgi:Aldo/keto reductase family